MAGVGSALSLFLTEDFSLDADVQFLSGINNQLDQSLQSSFVNLEAGHYLFDHQLLAIVGFGYQYHMTELHQTHLLTLHPGFSVETGRNFSLSSDPHRFLWA